MPEPNDEVIIRKYCDVLSAPSKSVIRHEFELPFPKAAIKGALKRDILRTSDPRELDLLKSVYASLADFQNMTAEEKEAVAFMSNLPDTTGFGTEQLRELAQRMASIGDSHQVVMDRYKVELDAVSNDLKSLAAERDQAKAQAHLVANRADALSVQPEPRYAAATAFLAISVLTLPLILLNGFGGVVGGVWLAVLREWTPLLRGILASLFGPLAISVVLMPGAFLFATPAAMLMQKGRLVLASPFILLAQTYTHLIVAAWAIFVFCLIAPGSTAITCGRCCYGCTQRPCPPGPISRPKIKVGTIVRCLSCSSPGLLSWQRRLSCFSFSGLLVAALRCSRVCCC